MDPKLWSYGTWILIFLFIEKYKGDIEKLKKVLWIICNNLPCDECIAHATENIKNNNIMSCDDYNIIKDFFIALYNKFKENQPYLKIEVL